MDISKNTGPYFLPVTRRSQLQETLPTMSERLVALAAAAVCTGLGVHFVTLALRRTESGPNLPAAYGLFATSVGLSCWAVC
jgi:hypothetical protein